MVIFYMTKPISFHQKLEKTQDSAYIAITGAICGTSKEKNMSRTGLRIHLKVDVRLGNYVPFLKF